ncbi:class I adenylate cyclase [Pseudomonas sp. dw_358]|uniref:class I adenylate cyclase n=1 Tax=Pseudomonas sp. dw_358 TaxID=2720083 RepID=UPI001BD2F6FC|nr:class I adenylate cyclase [Pseudomonas sp. dw_358]
MTREHEIRPNLDEGVDREVLAKLRARFMKLNDGRMARAVEGLSTRQQLVLKLMPLLFHVNHPLLPGYVSGATPAGISRYEPEAEELAELQRLTRSFSYRARPASAPRPIQGLFLMGSLGTLAQDEHSDLDVWVCHDPDLGDLALDELRKKCSLLEAWAETQGAEVHYFLIDTQSFAKGERDDELSTENCGSTQHYLLLDEFYRTAIWVAGRTPLWWLVPVYDEARYPQYVHTLISKRFIREDEMLDLGHMAHIPAGEFVGAGLWQLYKGLESPYKSVLKLLLTEVYASEHPNVQCLSLRFKQQVFANRLDLDELDPYMVVYRRIEEYLLARNEPERLELVRRSFYLKINKRLTGQPRQRVHSWQRELVTRLAEDWGWDERQLESLDSRSQWKVRQVVAERSMLVRELNYSYRFLTQFARNQQGASVINKRDFNVLGRRLYAAFERKANKVEVINPGIAPDLSEDTLTLVQAPNKREPGQTHWSLYNGNLGTFEWEHFAPFKRCRSLLELLAWSHRNGIIDSTTRIALQPGTSDLTEFELFNLIGSLQQSVPLPLSSVPDEQLLRPAVPMQVLLLVNIGVDPLKHHRDLNILMTTERTDSLSYAGARENLVLTLDQVVLNSWNELQTRRHDGPHALLECLRDYLNALPENLAPTVVRVRCFCHNRAPAIAQRVERLLATAQKLLRTRLNYRYLFQVEKQYHVLNLVPGNVTHTALASVTELLEYLGRELPRYSPLYLDPRALEESDLSLILPQAQPECIQVFYRMRGAVAEVYVIDEHNALWHNRAHLHDENNLLIHLQRFFEATLMRRQATVESDDPRHTAIHEVLFYRIEAQVASRTGRLEPRAAPLIPLSKGFYDVQAIIGKGAAAGQVQVTLYCNEQEFSQLEYGDQLFARVAREILGQRSGDERYPCYITDVDLNGLLGKTVGSTNLHLRYKTELERSLNRAMDEM